MGRLDDAATRQAVVAERALLGRLQGGCQVPVGALAELSEGVLTLRAAVYSHDGRQQVFGSRSGAGEQAESLGVALGDELIQRGAGELVRRPSTTP